MTRQEMLAGQAAGLVAALRRAKAKCEETRLLIMAQAIAESEAKLPREWDMKITGAWEEVYGDAANLVGKAENELGQFLLAASGIAMEDEDGEEGVEYPVPLVRIGDTFWGLAPDFGYKRGWRVIQTPADIPTF